MPTLLTYSFSTNPSPLPASPTEASAAVATLVVLATNLTTADVPLQGVSVLLPVGGNADQLTSTPDLIVAVAPAGWPPATKTPQAGGVKYVFRPPAGQPGLAPGKALAFSFNQVQPNTQVGTVPVVVTEGSAGNPTQTLLVTKFPASWGTVNFWVTPLTVAAGTGVQLAWQGPAGASYSLQYYDYATKSLVTVPASGQPPLRNSGTYPGLTDPPLLPAQTTTYTLLVNATVEGEPASTWPQATVTVLVPAPRILEFRTEPHTVVIGQPQPTVRLVWKTENASSISIEGIGTYPESEGSRVINAEASRLYLASAQRLPGNMDLDARKATDVLIVNALTIRENEEVKFPCGLILKSRYVTHTTPPYRGVSSATIDYFFDLQPGFEIAELGSFLPRPDLEAPNYGTIVGASYQRSMASNNYCHVDAEYGPGDYSRYYISSNFKAGRTWGIRFNNKYSVLWLAEISSPSLRQIRFTFNWLACDGAYKAAAVSDEPAAAPAAIIA